MVDFIVIAVVLAMVIGAVVFIIRQKKKGVKCIGCSAGGTCAGNCGCCAGNVGCEENTERAGNTDK